MASRPTNPASSNPIPPQQTTQPPSNARKTSAQRLRTLRIPGLKEVKGWSQKTTTLVSSDFKRPIKRVGFVVLPLFLALWLMSSVYNFFAGFFNRPQTPTPQAASQPVEVAKPTRVKDANKSNYCDGISGKMQTAKVSHKQVNKIFWEKHPEQRNKPISTNNKDLTQEWCQIADSLAKK
jgi:cytoskeletal protein RodZ